MKSFLCTKQNIRQSTSPSFLYTAHTMYPCYLCSAFFIFLVKQHRIRNAVWHYNTSYLKFLLKQPYIQYTRINKLITTYTAVPLNVIKFFLYVSFRKIRVFPGLASYCAGVKLFNITHTPLKLWRRFFFLKHLTSVQHNMYTLHVHILALVAKHITGKLSSELPPQRVVFTVDRERFILPLRNCEKVYYTTAIITDSFKHPVCVYPQVCKIARVQKLRQISSIRFRFARKCAFMQHASSQHEKKRKAHLLKVVIPAKKKKCLVTSTHTVSKHTDKKNVVIIKKKKTIFPAIKKPSTKIVGYKGTVIVPKSDTHTIKKRKAQPLKVVVSKKQNKNFATTKHAVSKNTTRKDTIAIKKASFLPVINKPSIKTSNYNVNVAVPKNLDVYIKRKSKSTTVLKPIMSYSNFHKSLPSASLIHRNMKYAFPYNNKLFLTYGYKHKHHNIGRAKVWEFISIRFGIGRNLAELLLSRVGASNNCMLATFFRYKCNHFIRELQSYLNTRTFDRIGLELICVYLKRLLASKSRKARRFAMQYPVHGQRTHTNASTARKLNLYFELSNRPTEYYYQRIFMYPIKQQYTVATTKRRQKIVRHH